MNFLFDRNCPKPMVQMIAIYAGYYGGHTVKFHNDVFEDNAPDEFWIRELGKREEPWIALSGDNRITRNKAERAALREANLNFFVFVPRWWARAPNLTVSQFMRVWPEIVSASEHAREPHVWEIPVSSSKLIDLGATQRF